MIERTPDIAAQLMRIKQALQIANTFAAKVEPVSRVVATILLDYVAESALKTVCSYHPTTPSTKREASFHKLLTTVAGLTGSPSTLPLQARIRDLHIQRNLTQHRNLTPSREDVSKNAVYVEEFLRDLFTRFFGEDFQTLSLAALVTHTRLREHLLAAEGKMAEQQYAEAVSESCLALFEVLLAAAEALRLTGDRWGPESLAHWRVQQAGFTSEQTRILEGLARELAKLRDNAEERFRVLALNLDYASYMRFKAVAPWVYQGMDGSIEVVHRKDDYSLGEATAIFDYALNQILRLEAMGALLGLTDEE